VNKIASIAPGLFNFIVTKQFTAGIIKNAAGFASGRSIPLLYKTTLRKWAEKNLKSLNPTNPHGRVCFFIDEFTDYNDTETGIKAIRLLTSLNYEVITADHGISARTYISKGLVRTAKKTIRRNIRSLSGLICEDLPLLGIEPSAILGFRDEYPELAGNDLKEDAKKLAENSFTIEEFISREFRVGKIDRSLFTDDQASVLVHAHCQQKAISSSLPTIEMLSIPNNYNVKEIPSGCCGMAGSFGYEKEHFGLSNKIGELILFPEIRSCSANSIISAPGTSCRHHIKDGTGKIAFHPAEVLYAALKK
jgi:Fe-S oxidoreductase